MRACILSVSASELMPEEAALLRDQQPWGVILMGRSCISRSQVRDLVESIWAAIGRECLVFTDQEGGRVARLKAPEWPRFPAAAAYGRLYARHRSAGLEACRLGHRLMAHELAPLGIRADCAPVLEVPMQGAHEVIGDRAFGNAPDQVISLGRAAMEGLAAGGVAPVIKHMPGHGRAEVDSHERLPRVTVSESDLADDFAPFQALNDAPMAMTAHITYDSIDAGRPATLSKTLISSVIRGRIGFEGLLMSDDLGMQALGGSLAERARSALAAGCDIALHCAGFRTDASVILAEMREIAEASAELDGQALARAQRAEAAVEPPDDFDAEAGWARLRVLMPELEAGA